MKKLMFAAIMALLAFSFAAHAADAVVPAAAQMPEWVSSVLTFITSIPKVGPFLSQALFYVGAVASFFTALTVFARAVLTIPMVAAKFSKSQEWVDKIDAISKKVSYYLDQLSIFNAKKK